MTPSEQQGTKKENQRRVGLLIVSCLYTFLFVGALYGWGPLQLLLEENGLFEHKCDGYEGDEDDTICPAQTAALLNVNLIAQLTILASPFYGWMIDTYEARTVFFVMTTCLWMGLGLMIVSIHFVDWLIYIAFVLVAQNSWIGAMLNVKMGMYFSGEHHNMRSRVIFALSSLFDAGAITYLGLWALHETNTFLGDNLTLLLSLYLALAVVLYSLGIYFWTVTVPEDGSFAQDSSTKKSEDTLKSVQSPVTEELDYSSSIIPVSAVQDDKQTDLSSTQKSDTGVLVADGWEVNERAKSDQGNNNGRKDYDVAPITRQTTTREYSSHLVGNQQETDDYVPIAQRTSRQQLVSGPFLLIIVYFSIHISANMFTFTTTRDFLAYLGDDEVGNKYLTIFTLLTPASVCGLPFVDHVLLRYGFHSGFQAVNLLALAHQIIRVSSDNLNVQVAGFVLFSFFRCFFFAITLSYLPMLFHPAVVGKATGILYAAGSIVSLINLPLVNVAVERLNGNFFIPNLVYTILVFPCILAACGLGRYMEKEKRAR